MQRAIAKPESQFDATIVAAVLPLLVLPAVACGLISCLPAWKAMWLFAVAIYLGLKWMTLASALPSIETSLTRALGYLALWPGMDARTFLDMRSQPARPAIGEWLLAIVNFSAGLVLLFDLVPRLVGINVIAAGWAGMVGLSLVLHFGIAHFTSLCWRLGGVNAQPIMNFPILASSLSDFWGRRWNMAFRDVAFSYVLRPLVRKAGVVRATMVIFVVSGLIHDMVISGPARGGWGGPSLYFVLQGLGLLVERSSFGNRFGLGRGIGGRAFCVLLVVGPVPMLFHESFVRHAILPTLAALGAN